MTWKTDLFFDLQTMPPELRQRADLKARCLDARERLSDIPDGDPNDWAALAQRENEGGRMIVGSFVEAQAC